MIIYFLLFVIAILLHRLYTMHTKLVKARMVLRDLEAYIVKIYLKKHKNRDERKIYPITRGKTK